MFTLGHLSDWHATSLDGAEPGAFVNKRFLGWLSWTVTRSRVHRPEVLEALFDDLKSQAPDHVAVTGDLTNVALEQEFVSAARWLRRLGEPGFISVVPGNHDAYVPIPSDRSWDHWGEFMRSDSDGSVRGGARAPTVAEFPTLRRRGQVAMVGVLSAHPTPFFRATGQIGEEQLGRLEARLKELGERGLCRVVLIHHPPIDGMLPPRRRLLDGAELRDMFRRVGAELVIHGHVHRTTLKQIEGPDGPIPTVGVRSSSDVGEKEHKRAQYHLYRIEPAPSCTGRRFRIGLEIRGYDPSGDCFVAEGGREL